MTLTPLLPTTLTYNIYASETIGIIDSGAGGLSIANSLVLLLPTHRFIYVADAAHLPYGQKTTEYLIERASKITRFLQSQNVRTIFVACHTLSATALPFLKELFPTVQYIDMVPGTIFKACATTNNKKVGVMATSATIASHLHKKLLLQTDSSLEVFEQACPLFVPLIEESASPDQLMSAIKTYLQPLLDQSVDTIILGCTHYPFIQRLLEEAAPHVTFISAANAFPNLKAENSASALKTTVHFVTTASCNYVQHAVTSYFKPTSLCTITYEAKDL